MFNWFRKPQMDPLSVSMTGAKLGDQLLLVGCSDPMLIAALAGKTGLTGRACAIDESADRAEEAARVAMREGVLIETASAPLHSLPFETASFNLAVLRDIVSAPDDERQLAVLREVVRVVRPGGRCMAINGTASPARGLGALFGSKSQIEESPAAKAIADAVRRAGFVAVRTLAERDGLIFVEGARREASART